MAFVACLVALLREEGEAAAERAEAAWRANPAGRALLARSGDDLSRSSRDYANAAARMIRDWQGAVLDMVADEGGEKKSRARFLAFGVNTVGVALMIVVFAYTGGLTGAEVGVAGGTAALAQRVLEAVFGDDAVRRLAKKAKADLDARVEALMAAELRRFHELLESISVDPERAERIRAASDAVAAARRERDLPGAPARARDVGPEQVDVVIPDEGVPALPEGASGEPYALEAGPETDDILEAEIVEGDGVRDGR